MGAFRQSSATESLLLKLSFQVSFAQDLQEVFIGLVKFLVDPAQAEKVPRYIDPVRAKLSQLWVSPWYSG
jgi:hypothetical protein